MAVWNKSDYSNVSITSMRKKAMTLAEVLITLGIIGVVVAMTIPGLMQNIQDREFKAAAKAAFSKASQAIQLMKVDSGGDLSEYYGINNANFKNDFMSHFKVVSNCGDNSECVPAVSSSTVYKTFYGIGADVRYMANGQFIANDGTFWAFNTKTYPTLLYIGVDVNGYGKGPNIIGRDVFYFNVIKPNDNLLPDGAVGTDCDNTYWTCLKTDTSRYSGCGCMTFVMQEKNY